jgi:hypothetical protein
MAGYVPNPFRAQLLEALVGKTALATATLYLGLATELPDNPMQATLVDTVEVVTPGYERVAIPAFGAATTESPVQITTPTAFTFGALDEDMLAPANYAFITDAATGTVGVIRYIFELPVPILARAGEPINVPASSLIIE